MVRGKQLGMAKSHKEAASMGESPTKGQIGPAGGGAGVLTWFIFLPSHWEGMPLEGCGHGEAVGDG